NRQAGQADAKPRTGRLGHLAVDQSAARFFRVARLDDVRFLEFEPQVVAFAGALAHSGEDGNAAVLHRHVVNQLLNQHGLADARAPEQPDLAAFEIRLDQVHDLDAGLEHLEIRGLILQRWRRAVNRIALLVLHRSEVVHRLSQHVHHAAERPAAHGYRDRLAEVFRLHAAHEAFGRLHRHGANAPLAEVLLYLRDDIERFRDVVSFARNAYRVVDQRQVA